MPTSAVASSPVSISGPSSQKVALSISTRSRTTSQSSLARAMRCIRLLDEPTAGFWPKRKYPFTVPSSMPSVVLVGGVVAGDAGEVVEAEVVVGGGVVAPPRLEQADQVGVDVGPGAGHPAPGGDVGGEVVVEGGVGHGQVAGEEVVEGGDVGGPLDAGVAPEGEDAAAGAADVAQEELDDGGGADVLHADRVLGPADGVAEGGGALAARVAAEGLGHLQELVSGDAAHLLHHLGRVAGVVALEHLEHAAGVLEGGIGLRRLASVGRAVGAVLLALGRASRRGAGAAWPAYCQRRVVVRAGLRVPAGEEAVEVLGVLEVLPQDGGRVGVGHHVVPELAAVGEDVVDDGAQEGDVAAGPDGDEDVGHRARCG